MFGIGARERAEILEALDSEKWDWYEEWDGCTLVSEVYWPNKYFPPCLRHDFDFLTGKDGLAANARFYRIMRAYGMTRARAAVRWLGVSAGWFGWFKWRKIRRFHAISLGSRSRSMKAKNPENIGVFGVFA